MATFTQKHYEFLASAFAREFDDLDTIENAEFRRHYCNELTAFARRLAQTLYSGNPNFKPPKFYEACGIKKENV